MNLRSCITVVATVAVAFLSSCCCTPRSPRVPIEGMWVRPSPSCPCTLQGFALFPGNGKQGPARSVNMCSPLYDSWKFCRSRLFLSGQSINTMQENHPFTSVFSVKMLTPDTLVLRNCCGERVYQRLHHVNYVRCSRPCPCAF